MGGTAQERVVEVYDPDRGYGTGCLVAPGLVLTALHVVRDDGGSIVHVRGLPGISACAKVVWRSPDLDAVLLATDRALGVGASPVRWGELVCEYPARRPVCTMAGFPAGMRQPLLEDPEMLVNDLKVVDGRIKPASGARTGTYTFEVDDAVPEHDRDWKGLSGAGVFCEGTLVGMALAVPADWQGRVMTVVPIHRLLAAPGFTEEIARYAGGIPELHPADLAPLLTASPTPRLSASYLLDPRSRVVPTTGMTSLLAGLRRWCNATDHTTDVALVTGRGGIGKTRLIPELLASLARPAYGPAVRRNWVGGFLAETPRHTEYEKLAAVNHPLLIAVDYAESRRQQVRGLLDALDARSSSSPIRVLLIARSHDSWWGSLRRRYHGHSVMPCGETFTVDTHDALEPNAEDVYVGAKIAFARRIRDLQQAGHGDPTWTNAIVADAPRTFGVGVEQAMATPVIHLHIDALADVLARANPEFARLHDPLDVLLAHEDSYQRKIATALMPDGQYDEDLMRTMVAVQYLVGAKSRERAKAATRAAYAVHHHGYPGVAVPDAVLRAYENCLTGLHASGDGAYWGGIGPDILAARLVAEVERASGHEFVEPLLLSPDLDQEQRIHTLSRIFRATAAHPKLAAATQSAVAMNSPMLLEPAIKTACAVLDQEAASDWLDALTTKLAKGVHQQAESDLFQRAIRIVEQVVAQLHAGVLDVDKLDFHSITEAPAAGEPAVTTQPPHRPANVHPAALLHDDGTTGDPSDCRAAVPSDDAAILTPTGKTPPTAKRRWHTEKVLAPAGWVARPVISAFGLAYLGIVGYVNSYLAYCANTSDTDRWLLPPAAIIFNLAIGVLYGSFKLPRNLPTLCAPVLIAILNIGGGLAYFQTRCGTISVGPAALSTAVTVYGMFLMKYTARAWTGQVRPVYTTDGATEMGADRLK